MPWSCSNKPLGFTCSTKDPGRIVYDILPMRFRFRKPPVSPIGRLDRDTTGLLLFTAGRRLPAPRDLAQIQCAQGL